LHLLILDPHDRGHYLGYVRHLLSEAAFVPRVTAVLRRGITNSEAFQQQLAGSAGRCDIDDAIRPESYRNPTLLREDLISAIQRHRPDHAWIPSADLLSLGASLPGSLRRWTLAGHTEAECGLVEIRFHRRPRRWRGYIRHRLQERALAATPWTRIHTIDPTVMSWVGAKRDQLARRMDLVPDPVDPYTPISKRHARTALGLPLEGRYVVAAGVHAIPRKGTGLLLKAFGASALAPGDRLLLAGPLGSALADTIAREYRHLLHADRLLTIDRYLDPGTLMTALSAADLVCTPYVDHWGSSAIVLQAAQAERPVLAPAQGWFADIVPALGLGFVGDILDEGRLAAALPQAVAATESFEPSPGSRRLVMYSDGRNFGRLWSRRLRTRLGIPPPDGILTWSDVVAAEEATESGDQHVA
jgi:hypothetical protein